MIRRCRFPDFPQSSLHRLPSSSCSSFRVPRISANSSCTTSSNLSPEACALARILNASSFFPREMSHRGDSGTNHMKIICNADGKACTREGVLHAQLPGILFVPSRGLVKNGQKQLVKFTESQPCCDETAHIPSRVIDRSVNRAMLRMD
jgi:hypothetical protein